jgi:hypothetical protein
LHNELLEQLVYHLENITKLFAINILTPEKRVQTTSAISTSIGEHIHAFVKATLDRYTNAETNISSEHVQLQNLEMLYSKCFMIPIVEYHRPLKI